MWGFDTEWTEPWNWSRFNAYAIKVKELNINITSYEYYTQAVITSLSLYRESLSLLPNLEKMSVDCCEGEGSRGYSIDFAILFLHENLQELVIYFDDIGTLPSVSKSGSQAYKAFLGLIPKRAPGLRSISLEAYDNEEEGCNASWNRHGFLWNDKGFVGLLSRLENLEELYVCPIFVHPDLIIALSRLQNLKHIDFCCNDAEHTLSDLPKEASIDASRYSWTSVESNQCVLSSLRTIKMDSSFSMAIPFLRGVASPALSALHITAQRSVSIKGIFWIISQKFPLLEKLRLESSLTNAVAGATNVWRLDTFQPLKSLAQLTHLSLTYGSPVYLSKDDFESLVSHWPLLEELRVTPPSDASEEIGIPYLTPHALSSLAKHCPNLRSLAIDVDWALVDTLITGDLFVSPEAHTKHNLSKITSVDFGRSPVEEGQTAAIATFLVDLSIASSAVQLPDSNDHEETEAEQNDGAQQKDEIAGRWKDIKKFMTIAAHYRYQIQCLQSRIAVLEAQFR